MDDAKKRRERLQALKDRGAALGAGKAVAVAASQSTAAGKPAADKRQALLRMVMQRRQGGGGAGRGAAAGGGLRQLLQGRGNGGGKLAKPGPGASRQELAEYRQKLEQRSARLEKLMALTLRQIEEARRLEDAAS